MHSEPNDLSRELLKRQRNTLWPDALQNSKSVDEFLWKGSAKPPMVQRVGAIVFGLFFLVATLAFSGMAVESRSVLLTLLALGFLYLGVKVLRNGWPRKSK